MSGQRKGESSGHSVLKHWCSNFTHLPSPHKRGWSIGQFEKLVSLHFFLQNPSGQRVCLGEDRLPSHGALGPVFQGQVSFLQALHVARHAEPVSALVVRCVVAAEPRYAHLARGAVCLASPVRASVRIWLQAAFVGLGPHGRSQQEDEGEERAREVD